MVIFPVYLAGELGGHRPERSVKVISAVGYPFEEPKVLQNVEKSVGVISTSGYLPPNACVGSLGVVFIKSPLPISFSVSTIAHI